MRIVGSGFVVVKLKYHRLKPGGVPTVFPDFVVLKFKHHRLKPGSLSHDKLKHIAHSILLCTNSK